MAIYTPRDTTLQNAFQQAGQAATQGYMDRSDEIALKNTIGSLPPDASPRQIIDAITGTRTHNPAAKQNAIKNYMGVAEFEEAQRRVNSTIQQNQAKLEAEQTEIANERQNVKKLVNLLDIPEKDREVLGDTADLKTVQDLVKDQYKNATSDKDQKELLTGLNGLEIIDEMRNIGKKGNLGRGSGILSTFGGETAEDYGTYEQLGKSLISLASPIVIRNRVEFEILAENLYDPSLSDAKREGILKGMERIIRLNLRKYETNPGKFEKTVKNTEEKESAGLSVGNKPRPLSDFRRKQ